MLGRICDKKYHKSLKSELCNAYKTSLLLLTCKYDTKSTYGRRVSDAPNQLLQYSKRNGSCNITVGLEARFDLIREFSEPKSAPSKNKFRWHLLIQQSVS